MGNKEIMVNPADEETQIIDLIQEGTLSKFNNLNNLRRTRYTNLMQGNESVNKMTNKGAIASITVHNVQTELTKVTTRRGVHGHFHTSSWCTFSTLREYDTKKKPNQKKQQQSTAKN